METRVKFSFALVTGASSGIGAEVCRKLASKGIPLLITGRDVDHLNALAAELRPQVPVNIIVADMGTDEGRQSLIKKIHEHTPDLIINNAGFGYIGPIEDFSLEEIKTQYDTNIFGIIFIRLL